MKNHLFRAIALSLLFTFSFSAGGSSKPTLTVSSGLASFYGSESGNITANGERFNPWALTAAHKTLPFNTKVKVVNLKNHKSVVVRINDRGPFVKGRIIDLSRGAAKKIGINGVSLVSLQIL